MRLVGCNAKLAQRVRPLQVLRDPELTRAVQQKRQNSVLGEHMPYTETYSSFVALLKLSAGISGLM